MNRLYRTALAARVTATAPFRQARMQRLAAQSLAPISVLFYHRVADDSPNDWTISCDGFQRHIDYCRAQFDLISLSEVQRRINEKDSPVPAASLTFDDGYRDNCAFALPLLVEQQIPCTYFVATSLIRNQQSFPHDVAAGNPLAVNTVAQIREAAEAGIEIGCHTRTHIDFSDVVDPQVIRDEIVDSKKELEQMIGRPVRYFAFPYGMPKQLTQIAIEAVYEAGYAGFCSAFGGYNLPGKDAFHIRRFHGDPEYARFVNWLGFDQRKLRLEPTVQYFLPPCQSFDETVATISEQLRVTHHTPTETVSPSCC